MRNAQWEHRRREKYDGGAYMNQTWHKAIHQYPSRWLGRSDKLDVGGVSRSRYCTISFNSTVTRHGALQTAEM